MANGLLPDQFDHGGSQILNTDDTHERNGRISGLIHKLIDELNLPQGLTVHLQVRGHHPFSIRVVGPSGSRIRKRLTIGVRQVRIANQFEYRSHLIQIDHFHQHDCLDRGIHRILCLNANGKSRSQFEIKTLRRPQGSIRIHQELGVVRITHSRNQMISQRIRIGVLGKNPSNLRTRRQVFDDPERDGCIQIVRRAIGRSFVHVRDLHVNLRIGLGLTIRDRDGKLIEVVARG